ncbi:MAG TPA: hypothetical protein VD735_03400 [Candidatus Saccharimonadales bacterium]|nr:hypothetical protein [Candidatus Saccharimonadales bacterium]
MIDSTVLVRAGSLYQQSRLVIGALLLGMSAVPFVAVGKALALSGAGTSGSPYQITSCADFADIENDMNAHYRLMNDIDCSASGDTFTVDLRGRTSEIPGAWA